MNKTKLLCKILAATLALSALSGCSKGISSYEKLIEQFQTSVNEKDEELFAQVLITEGMFAYLEEKEDMDYDDVMDEIENFLDEEFDKWESKYGDDPVLTIEIKDAKKLDDEDDIEEIVEAYEDSFDENIEIKAAYELKCKFKIEGEDDYEKTTEKITVINIKNQGWKIAVAGGSSSEYLESLVNSANSIAASIMNNIDSFLTNCDTYGYGMKHSSNDELDILVTTTDGVTTWEVSACTAENFKSNAYCYWGNTGYGTRDSTKSGVTSAETLLAIELARLFPEIKQASIHAVLSGCGCRSVAYTSDKNTPLIVGTDCPEVIFNENGRARFAETFEWDGKNAGVSEDRLIVGTSPVVLLD